MILFRADAAGMAGGLSPDSSAGGLLHRLRSDAALSWMLALMTAVTYLSVGSLDFVQFDDPLYVFRNDHVRAGLTWDGVKWAFTTYHAGNWHPVTWLSLMLDAQLFGVSAAAFHVVNAAFHLINVLLLFHLLRPHASNPWPAFLAAALFAVHPQHVESVAWVSERKDVLSTFFWLLTMLAYQSRYRKNGKGISPWVMGWFALGLMSKPMLVTLPCILLIWDFWPLGRFRRLPSWSTLAEKMPLFAMTVLFCLVTIVAQGSTGAISSIPLPIRLTNAVISIARYLEQTVWPFGLTPFYPYNAQVETGWFVVSVMVIVLLTYAVIRFLDDAPFLAAGWAWYLVALIPVIGLIQVGSQARADRYVYIPHIGLFFAFSWAMDEVFRSRLDPSKGKIPRYALIAAIGAVLCFFMILTSRQVFTWKDTRTMFQRNMEIVGENLVAHANLGRDAFDRGDLEAAIRHFRRVLDLRPDHPDNDDIHVGIGAVHANRHEHAQAIEQFRKALAITPNYPDLQFKLGISYMNGGHLALAIEHFRKAVEESPENIDARNNLGICLASVGKTKEAVEVLESALRLAPDDPAVRRNLDRARKASSGSTDSPQ